MNKLTKAQEKRFDKKFKMSLLSLIPMIPNKRIDFDIKQHLANELATQKKESFSDGVAQGHFEAGEDRAWYLKQQRKEIIKWCRKRNKKAQNLLLPEARPRKTVLNELIDYLKQ